MLVMGATPDQSQQQQPLQTVMPWRVHAWCNYAPCHDNRMLGLGRSSLFRLSCCQNCRR